jgi:hypothetical protein
VCGVSAADPVGCASTNRVVDVNVLYPTNVSSLNTVCSIAGNEPTPVDRGGVAYIPYYAPSGLLLRLCYRVAFGGPEPGHIPMAEEWYQQACTSVHQHKDDSHPAIRLLVLEIYPLMAIYNTRSFVHYFLRKGVASCIAFAQPATTQGKASPAEAERAAALTCLRQLILVVKEEIDLY